MERSDRIRACLKGTVGNQFSHLLLQYEIFHWLLLKAKERRHTAHPSYQETKHQIKPLNLLWTPLLAIAFLLAWYYDVYGVAHSTARIPRAVAGLWASFQHVGARGVASPYFCAAHLSLPQTMIIGGISAPTIATFRRLALNAQRLGSAICDLRDDVPFLDCSSFEFLSKSYSCGGYCNNSTLHIAFQSTQISLAPTTTYGSLPPMTSRV